MTYEEIFYRIRDVFEEADARGIFVHIAIQINIEGEAAGIFYVEVAQCKVSVEPYDYVDRDLIFVTNAQTLSKLADGEITFAKAVSNGDIKVHGDMEKFKLLSKIKLKKKKKK